MQTIWFFTLLIVVGVAYYWGYTNGAEQAQALSEEALFELEIYKIDKFFENERWKFERKDEHESPHA